jgi:hypothetical protein
VTKLGPSCDRDRYELFLYPLSSVNELGTSCDQDRYELFFVFFVICKRAEHELQLRQV